MVAFIGLISLTDQGIRNVKDSPRRFEAFQGMAEKLGVAVRTPTPWDSTTCQSLWRVPRKRLPQRSSR